jgi:hypothetical protein
MRRFLINLVYFAVPFVLFSVGGDFLISSSLQRSAVFAAGEYPVWNAIYNGDLVCDIAVYGSSRAYVHINPQILEDLLGYKSYNFGIDGHNFWTQYFRHEQYLGRNPNPRLIICSLDMSTLAGRGNLYNPEQFLPYMLFDPSIASFTQPYQYFAQAETYVPMLRYAGRRGAILHAGKQLLSPESADGRVQGFKGQDNKWIGNDPAIPGDGLLIRPDSDCIDLFGRFLSQCQQNSIQVVLVYTPEFIGGQARIRNRQEIIATYTRLAQLHNVPFIDYSSDSLSHDQRNFYNTNHLNKTAADRFTEILVRDLVSLSILKPR